MLPKIFLIGYMGSGKSYWKNRLSKKYRVRGYDLDHLIEAFEEQTIAEIFEEKGESVFREKEATALRWFRENKSFILATGGGTPCFHDNMDWMNRTGLTVWLDESPSVLAERLLPEKKHRPMISHLSDNDFLDFITQQRNKRLPFYEQARIHLRGEQIGEGAFQPIFEANE
jgi:shikimate kinase